MIDKQGIGQRLVEIREINNYNQKKFGKQLGITQQSLSGIEKGDVQLSLKLLIKLTENFGISYDWILFGKGNMYKDAITNEAEIVKPYESDINLGSIKADEPATELKSKPANYEAALLYIGFLEGLIERTLKKLITNFKID